MRFRVLLIDDEERLCEVLKLGLERSGPYEVGFATDGKTGLLMARKGAPDVILLDHHLPGVSGVDVIEGLRSAAPRARVLMLTINEDGETLVQALQRGAHGYLLKTVDSDVLFDAIRKAVAGQSTVSPEMTGKLVRAFQALHAPVLHAPVPTTAPAR